MAAGILAATPLHMAVLVMTTLAAASFLRDLLANRLPDVWGLLPLQLGIVFAAAWRLTRYRVAVRSTIGLVLALTTIAVAVVGEARQGLNVAQAGQGIAGMAERFSSVSRELTTSPVLSRDEPGTRDVLTVVRFLTACTAPSDRLFAFAFIPELFYLTGRGFAAGYPAFGPDRHASHEIQQLGIDRWRRQSVPYAVAYEETLAQHQQWFPLIGEELQRRYEPVASIAATPYRKALIVFAERNRRAVSTYEPLGTPCLVSRSAWRSGR
jgi:hypothetical protein